MGNCNCFNISQQKASGRPNDFLLEEGNGSDSNNPNNNFNENEFKNNKKEIGMNSEINQKVSPRGVNNPTQNNIKQRVNQNNKESETVTDLENFVKGNISNNIPKEKFDETCDKYQENIESITSLNKFNQKSANNQTTNNINITKESINSPDNNTNNNGNQDEFSQNTSNLVKNPSLNNRLTEILKLKDLSKKLKNKNNSINIIILGDKCVGKTSLVYQYISNKFDQYYIQTIIKEEFTKAISVNNKKYNLNFTVTSGVREYQEDYTNLYKIADFFIICYDVTNSASFEKAKEIITKEIYQYLFLYNEGYANIILFGNKCDLKERAIDNQQVKEYCYKHSIDFYETSAKLKTNFIKAFNKLAEVYDEALGSISK